MGVNNVDPDPTGGRGLLHEGRGNPPKRSPNCNGHPASSSIQVYRDGEISFIPLQERGIILHGKPMFISFHYNSVLNTSYLTESYIVFTLIMESVSKNTIFGLKMMVKSGLEKIFLKFLHARDYFLLLHKSAQNHKFSNKNNYLSAWKDFKIIFSRPLFTIILSQKWYF